MEYKISSSTISAKRSLQDDISLSDEFFLLIQTAIDSSKLDVLLNAMDFFQENPTCANVSPGLIKTKNCNNLIFIINTIEDDFVFTNTIRYISKITVESSEPFVCLLPKILFHLQIQDHRDSFPHLLKIIGNFVNSDNSLVEQIPCKLLLEITTHFGGFNGNLEKLVKEWMRLLYFYFNAQCSTDQASIILKTIAGYFSNLDRPSIMYWTISLLNSLIEHQSIVFDEYMEYEYWSHILKFIGNPITSSSVILHIGLMIQKYNIMLVDPSFVIQFITTNSENRDEMRSAIWTLCQFFTVFDPLQNLLPFVMELCHAYEDYEYIFKREISELFCCFVQCSLSSFPPPIELLRPILEGLSFESEKYHTYAAAVGIEWINKARTENSVDLANELVMQIGEGFEQYSEDPNEKIAEIANAVLEFVAS